MVGRSEISYARLLDISGVHMSVIKGAKLYVAAVFAVAFAMRLTIGEAPFDADLAATIGWVLNGIIAGLGTILGPEVADGVRSIVVNLAGNAPGKTES